MVTLLILAGVAICALVVTLGIAGRTNQWLRVKILDLERKLNKPFDLDALENVRDSIGGLSPALILAAYAAVAVGERPNKVLETLAKARSANIVSANQTKLKIDDLHAQLANAESRIRVLGDRAVELADIERMLPPQ